MTASRFIDPGLAPTALLVVLAAFAASGCKQQSARLPVFPASGAVHADGRAAAGVRVVLYPAAETAPRVGALRPQGVTDAAGRFVLSTYVRDDGAPAGDWIVTCTWPDQRLNPQLRQQIEANGDSVPDRFRGRYAAPDRSRWQARIAAGTNEIPLINLPLR
jgi:hypothetical protein